MTIIPSREEFLKLGKPGSVIPVYTDLMADFETPVSAYAKLRGQGPSYLLESVEGGERLSRYSFIGCRPRKVFICGEKTTEIRNMDGSSRKIPTPPDPLSLLEQEMLRRQAVHLPDLPRFTGGAVGFVSYEYIHRVERSVPKAEADELGMPLLYFMVADSVLIFDRVKQTLRICVSVHVEDSAELAYAQAEKEINALYELLKASRSLPPVPMQPVDKIPVLPGNFQRGAFEHFVEEAKEYIRSGDIIQIVPSQRFSTPYEHDALDLYRALRTVNPSPYTFILDAGNFSLVGASPEVHARLTDGLVEMRPIAGTRKRGRDLAEDVALEKELLADEKELAEHLMLVDLARNDISRVCEIGSVNVPQRNVIERYSHVMHIVSQVEGRIRKDKNACDLIRATFPAGTVSGAPKVRAMQLLAKYEPVQRGFYAGLLGYMGYDGNLDSCIMLRTSLLKGGQIYIQSGCGVVADSHPEAEYQETINKASALFKAVAVSKGFGN